MNGRDYARLVDLPCSEAQLECWVNLSAATIDARVRGRPGAIQSDLEAHAKASSEGPFRTLYWYWLASNALVLGGIDAATTYLDSSLECAAGEGSLCRERSVERAIRELLAQAHLELGHLDAALEQYEVMGRLGNPNDLRPMLLAASACERCGKAPLARQYYEKVSERISGGGGRVTHEYAQRARERLAWISTERD